MRQRGGAGEGDGARGMRRGEAQSQVDEDGVERLELLK